MTPALASGGAPASTATISLVLAKFSHCAKVAAGVGVAPNVVRPVERYHSRGRFWLSDLHPAAPHHLPGFITGPGDTDFLMIGVGIFLILAVVGVGNLYLHLHSLPERMAHKSKKLQFEIVAVLCLLSLFTHNHLYWVIGLFLALVDLPDFITPLRRIAGSVDKLAGVPPEAEESDMPRAGAAHGAAGPDTATVGAAKSEVQGHA
jgi:hypothetical protein